jgi:hypothetical protein
MLQFNETPRQFLKIEFVSSVFLHFNGCFSTRRQNLNRKFSEKNVFDTPIFFFNFDAIKRVVIT